jgi:hypothetical protein
MIISNNLKDKWLPQQPKNKSRLNKAIGDLHHAAQFVAMAGNSFLPHEPDDSHTNMEWSNKHQALTGKWIQGNELFRIGLKTLDFSLIIENQDEEIFTGISLAGYSVEIIENWLKIKLTELGIPAEKLNMERHYQIPDYGLDHGMPYGSLTKGILKEIANYRSNNDMVLKALGSGFEFASPVNTWPHHFDTGIYIPLEKNKNNEVIRSFSAGWAIADDYYEEPYYYITYWPSESIDKEKLPELESEANWQIIDFFGLMLPVSKITAEKDAGKQFELVKKYIEEGVSFIERFK